MMRLAVALLSIALLVVPLAAEGRQLAESSVVP